MDHELSANLVSIIAIGTFIEASFDYYLFYFKMKLHVTMEKVLRTNIGNFISVFWWVTFIKKKTDSKYLWVQEYNFQWIKLQM